MLNLRAWLILLGLLQVLYVTKTEPLDMVWKRVNCSSSDPEGLMGFLNCTTSGNERRRTLQVEFNFTQDITMFDLDVVFWLPQKPNNLYLLNVTNENGCLALQAKTSKNLLNYGSEVFGIFGNFPKNCPFKKNKLYFIHNFRFDMTKFGSFPFESYFDLKLNVRVRGNNIIKVVVHGHVFNKKKKSNIKKNGKSLI